MTEPTTPTPAPGEKPTPKTHGEKCDHLQYMIGSAVETATRPEADGGMAMNVFDTLGVIEVAKLALAHRVFAAEAAQRQREVDEAMVGATPPDLKVVPPPEK